MADFSGINPALQTPMHVNSDCNGAAVRTPLRNLDPGAEHGPAYYFEPLDHD